MKKNRLFIVLTLVVTLMISNLGLSSNATVAAASETGLVFQPGKQNHVKLDKVLSEIPTTFEAKIKLAKDHNQRQVIFGNYKAGAAAVYSVELSASNQLRYYEISNGTVKDRTTTDLAIVTGEWINLAVTRDVAEKQVAIYINGQQVQVFKDLELADPKIVQSNTHSIGTDTRNGMFLNGEVADVRLWSNLRKADEITQFAEVTGAEAGLMHAWELDPSVLSGIVNVIKDKAGKNDATPMNFSRTYTSEFEGKGIDFASGKLELAVEKRFSGAPRTVEAWLKVPANTPASKRVGTVLGNYAGDVVYNDISRFNFEINTNGNPRIYWQKTGAQDQIFGYVAENVNINLGDWVHVAIAIDDENKKTTTYINGEKMHEAAATVPIPNDRTWREIKIGSDYRGYSNGVPSLHFNGEIADVRVWSTTRTADEIKANYNKYLQGKETGLMGNWKLDEMVDNKYKDVSTEQNNAFIYNNETTNWLEPNFPEGDYTIAVIPDTQYLISHQPAFTNYMTWIRDNAEKLNIELAIQVGDLVDAPRNDAQWTSSSNGMKLLDGVMPYVFSTGNHDMVITKDPPKRDTTKYNQYYPYEKYSKEPTFGGAFKEGMMDNTYHFVTIKDVEYMIVAMEFAPNDEVLAWANEAVAANKDKRVIITTHSYMYHTGEQITNKKGHSDPPSAYLADGNNGDDQWNEFVSKHKNIILVTSGHIGYHDLAKRVDIGEHGNPVTQMLVDAQFMQRDLGMVMLMTFKEGSNDVAVNWYSVTKNKFYRAANQFNMNLNVYPDGGGEPNPTEPTLALADQTVTKGSMVTVPLTLSDAEQVTGLNGLLEYDKNLLTLEKFEFDMFKETGAHNTTVAGKIGFAGVAKQPLGTKEPIVVAQAVFRAKADLTEDAVASLVLKKVQASIDENETSTVAKDVKVSNASITIKASGLLGDINGDLAITIVDARMLLKMIVAQDQAELAAVKDIADLNKDGLVNTADVIAILQMIADQLAE
ncbi:LamG-like jellyroll fold domain-containing protein [Paenibacillus yanchengensis]|uniref:LamG-like jellyroll fold domain-containing protein n=1 Tax=Paenibacillus yanchengensis TaxID=2035833 RepID=A0ABW4YGE7_9BACL